MNTHATSSTKKFGAGLALLCFVAGAALLSFRSVDSSSEALSRALMTSDCSCKPTAEFDWSYNYECTYQEHGQVAPDMWGALYPDCLGVRQSPINIARDIVTTDCTLAPVTGAFVFDMGACMLDDLDYKADGKGWTVTFDGYCQTTPTITINGAVFNLLQFHLHSVSEHVIGGGYYDAEIHFVHYSALDPTSLAVVGVMISSTSDNIGNLEFTKYVEHMAYVSGKQKYASEIMETDATMAPAATPSSMASSTSMSAMEQVNPYSMLPADGTYYNYLGSLTTPPCSETVTWIVMKEGITVSPDQLEAFRAGLMDPEFPLVDNYGNNARPPQPTNGRMVYQCVMA
mmetsp:Transcript_434/g.617  ORF Transcript_434/g.617 Transcript_434/m.617 type:complete len:343 (+) Transcript_434:129-1157(+)